MTPHPTLPLPAGSRKTRELWLARISWSTLGSETVSQKEIYDRSKISGSGGALLSGNVDGTLYVGPGS